MMREQNDTRREHNKNKKSFHEKSVLISIVALQLSGGSCILPKEKTIEEKTEAPAPVKATVSKKPVRKPKLPPKNKPRLPRKEKKAAQKAAARA